MIWNNLLQKFIDI